jgi:glycosyl transferase family 87
MRRQARRAGLTDYDSRVPEPSSLRARGDPTLARARYGARRLALLARQRRWIAAYALVVAAFLAGVSRYYHPPFGFTAFIDFSPGNHPYEIPAVRSAPHFDNPGSTGYDGAYYAQLAVDPLLRDPAIDHALDDPPYRARRILFSWTAYALGLGRPAWILQVYAMQNVIVWLLFAWLLCRWMPPSGPRAFVLWTGCVFSPGLIFSVRYALPDGPSALLIACAVVAAERARPVFAAVLVGMAGLARETSLLAAILLGKFIRRDWRTWVIVAVCALICLVPLALWVDYLRSIYRSRAFTNPGQLTMPLVGLMWKLKMVRAELAHAPFSFATMTSAFAVISFLAQGGWAVREVIRREDKSAWALVGASYLVLGLIMHPVVWDGTPGAFTRVLLPLTISTNVLLAARPRASWAMIIVANLAAVPCVLSWAMG